MRRVAMMLLAFRLMSLGISARAQQPLPKPPPLPKPMVLPKAPSPPPPQIGEQKGHRPGGGPSGDNSGETTRTNRRKTPKTPSSQVVSPTQPAAGDRMLWSAPVDIRYGATFDFRGPDPYGYTSEEAYQFVETEGSSPIKVLGYCEEKVPFRTTDPPESFCPFQSPPGAELRLSKQSILSDNEHASRSYLHEEFVLSARPIWILIEENNRSPKWRFLNYFQGLQDPFRTPNSARMTTLLMPSHTFVSLDQAQREDSPDADIYHFPRQFLFETLQPRTTVITRINPTIPRFLRWGAQKLLTLGVASVVWQWVLLLFAPLTPVAVIGWVLRLAFHKK